MSSIIWRLGWSVARHHWRFEAHRLWLTLHRAFAVACTFVAVAQAFGAPLITSFSPIAGSAGDQILLVGAGFSSGNLTVRFWNGGAGVVARIVFVSSDTTMTVTVPSGITTGPISIQQGTGTAFVTPADFLAIGTGPYIFAVDPEFGVVGATVSITGVHFANTRSVLFHGTSAADVSVNAAGTQITTRVPAGATSGAITVTTGLGTGNSPAAFTVVGSGPYVTVFAPVSGDARTLVQIEGLHFTGANRVTFNGQSGVNLAANSDFLIQVKAPAGVTTGPLGVYTTMGSFFTSSNFFANPAITAFSPVSGRPNTNVLVSGKNLIGTTAVFFNGVPATNFTVLNNSNMNVSVPLGALSGTLRLVAPGGSAVSTGNFTVRPTLASFSPAFGPVGTSVTLAGANFDAGSSAVRFNGIQAGPPTSVAFGKLTVAVPSGATTGLISLSTVDGSDTNSTPFYLPASITAFGPTNAPAGGRIGITGQNFVGTMGVSFNGTAAASFIVTNNTSMSAVVPPGLATGPVTVTTPAGAVVSSGLFYGAPVIANFTPAHGLPGDNVKITGLNFLAATVGFNQLAAKVTSLNNTQIVAIVPNGATTGPIRVLGPAGTNASATSFVLDYLSDLRISITDSVNPVTVGSNLVYKVTIANGGPAAAPNVVISNILPASATLRSASINPPWALTTNGNVLVAGRSTLDVASSDVLTLVLVPHTPGNITNRASVTSGYSDPSPGDNTSSIVTIVESLPWLSAALVANRVQLSWPVALSNFSLQYRDQFPASSGWTVLVNQPVITGNLRVVTETNNRAGRFYRLRR